MVGYDDNSSDRYGSPHWNDVFGGVFGNAGLSHSILGDEIRFVFEYPMGHSATFRVSLAPEKRTSGNG